MGWQKGQSGNPNGRAKDKKWRDALERALKRVETGEDLTALEKLADKTVAMGLDGDMQAIKEIGDRLDGKPAQAIIGGDPDDPPVKTVNRVELVAGVVGTDQTPA